MFLFRAWRLGCSAGPVLVRPPTSSTASAAPPLAARPALGVWRGPAWPEGEVTESWLYAFHQGEPSLIKPLWAEAVRRMQGWVRRILPAGDAFDRDEVIMRTGTKAFCQCRQSFREGAFAAWLWRICHNEAVDYAREQARLVPVEDIGAHLEAAPAQDGEREQLLAQLCPLLDQFEVGLSSSTVEVFRLVFREGLTNREAARRLGHGHGYVNERVRRLWPTLRAFLSARGFEP